MIDEDRRLTKLSDELEKLKEEMVRKLASFEALTLLLNAIALPRN